MADYGDLVAKIQQTASEFDRTGVAAACAELIEEMQANEQPAPLAPVKKALGALRNKRYFDFMVQVADAAIQSGRNDPQIQRQFAQGLIDQGNITAAISALKVLERDTALGGALTNPSENAEARGLLGRAFKQAYVNAVNVVAPNTLERKTRAKANRRNLDAAITAYYEVYTIDRNRYLWHGINTVACVARADRDGIGDVKYPNPRDIATEILATIDTVTPVEKIEIFDRATAVEACVALDDQDKALHWLATYAPSATADAFELGSTLRQLEEVWELTPAGKPGSHILPVLHSELLKRQGGGVDLASQTDSLASSLKQERKALEAILGDTRFVSLKWYKTGLDRCTAIARFETQWGIPYGSGFLVRGDDLHPTFKGETLLLTNAHVVSDDPVVQNGWPRSFPPEQVLVTFEARNDGKKYAIKELLWTSPPGELDATLLRLEETLTCEPPYPLAITLPAAKDERVYVIGHPNGGPLSMSMQDNRVIEVHDPKIQYRAPTEPGSSGSPVFNQNWQLVALHHAGSKQMPSLAGPQFVEANEGIWINAVVAAIGKKFDVGKAR